MRLKIDKPAIDKTFAQITDNLSEQDRDDLARRAAKMAVLVKNPERIRAVVQHLVTHYQTKIEPNSLKAQVVTFDRECCVLYKQVMDELVGPEASAIVMHAAVGDPPEWRVHARNKDEEEKLIARLRKHMGNPKFTALGERLEKIKELHEQGFLTSLEFLKQILELAKEVLEVERKSIRRRSGTRPRRP